VTRITDSPASDTQPSWSADGTQLAFTSTRVGGTKQIFVKAPQLNASATQLTAQGANHSPSFGRATGAYANQIAFVTNRDGDDEIFRMSAAGANETRVTTNAAADGKPNWGAESTLTFHSKTGGTNDVFVTLLTGSLIVPLRATSAAEMQGVRSPVTDRLAFVSDADGDREIYVSSYNGTSPVQITFNGKTDESPDWQPVQLPPIIIPQGVAAINATTTGRELWASFYLNKPVKYATVKLTDAANNVRTQTAQSGVATTGWNVGVTNLTAGTAYKLEIIVPTYDGSPTTMTYTHPTWPSTLKRKVEITYRYFHVTEDSDPWACGEMHHPQVSLWYLGKEYWASGSAESTSVCSGQNFDPPDKSVVVDDMRADSLPVTFRLSDFDDQFPSETAEAWTVVPFVQNGPETFTRDASLALQPVPGDDLAATVYYRVSVSYHS
jgi:TolB protein